MARKSRKNRETESGHKGRERVYNTAMYARLSVADNGGQGDSIKNQIQIMQTYIDQHPELQVAYTFVDHGETGTDFRRPAFSDMMEAVKRGRINCIVVKDLSRFGRNYLETGNYLENIFPSLHVRFISVNDRFDSFHSEKSDMLLVPLKSILHDMYAKDISEKVSSAIDVKKKAGKFLGKIPPYGYVRDEQDRYRLRIHSERAHIIRMIFAWRTEGLGPVSIARRLNEMGVPTQFQIRHMEGHPDGKEQGVWSGSAVSGILKNPCYTGCIVERKGSCLLCTGRGKETVPEAEWNLIAHTHEPIIEKEVFQKVQRMREESRKRRSRQPAGKSCRQKTENLLRGMVRCGICGGCVYRDSGYFRKDGSLVHYRFYCSNQYNGTNRCSLGAVDEEELQNCIFQVCSRLLALFGDSAALRGQLQSAGERLWEYGKRQAAATTWRAAPEPFKNTGKLTKEMCSLMVKQVVLYESRVQIYFAFADGYETYAER